MATNDIALRKRSQIARANRTMFIWIAIASALIGTAAVVSIFLSQKILYTEKVLSAKQSTVSTLEHNLSVVDTLQTDIKALDANSALMSARANDTDQALQVVLDALPSDANSPALGASLQSKLLAGIPGKYSLESLQVTPVTGVESLASDNTTSASTGTATGKISFNFLVKGDQAALKQVLRNLERSIRTINVTHLSMETRANELTLTVQGEAYYQPAKTIGLTDKTVPVKGK